MLVPTRPSRSSLSTGTRLTIATASLAIALSSAANAQWTAVSLHPPGALTSRALGTFGGQHVGNVDGDAAVWNGSTSAYVALEPGVAFATDGVHQVGTNASGGSRRWAGAPGTGLNLLLTGIPYFCTVTAIDADIAVGWQSHVLSTYPVSWSGTSGSYVSAPLVTGGFFLYGISAGDAVGAVGSTTPRACLIPDMNGSLWVDLAPAGSTSSIALDAYGSTQVGWATFGTSHAGMWSGSAASWVDLAPAGSTESQAVAAFGTRQVGYATFAGVEHAGLWTGTANTWFDLHALLPATYTASRATGVWVDAMGSEFVCGWAVNANGSSEAFLWRNLVTGTPFCFGDDSVTPCPCGNVGDTFRGCGNSIEWRGGRLAATGVASVGNDQLQLTVVGVPDGPGLFFQGSIQVQGGLGSTFGDGLRCAGGSIVRLGVVVASGNAAQYPRPGIDPSVSVQGNAAVGSFFAYQHYYRDTASFCTSATFNLTNGVLIPWVP